MEPEEDPCGAAVREVFEEVIVTPAAILEGPRSYFENKKIKKDLNSAAVLRAHPCILGVPCPSWDAQSETPEGPECRWWGAAAPSTTSAS